MHSRTDTRAHRHSRALAHRHSRAGTHTRTRTGALAALVVRFQSPTLVAGTLDGGFLLDAALTTLQVLGAEALDLAGLVIRAEFHPSWAGAQDALAGGDGTVMAAATVLQRAQVCSGEREGNLVKTSKTRCAV